MISHLIGIKVVFTVDYFISLFYFRIKQMISTRFSLLPFASNSGSFCQIFTFILAGARKNAL